MHTVTIKSVDWLGGVNDVCEFVADDDGPARFRAGNSKAAATHLNETLQDSSGNKLTAKDGLAWLKLLQFRYAGSRYFATSPRKDSER